MVQGQGHIHSFKIPEGSRPPKWGEGKSSHPRLHYPVGSSRLDDPQGTRTNFRIIIIKILENGKKVLINSLVESVHFFADKKTKTLSH